MLSNVELKMNDVYKFLVKDVEFSEKDSLTYTRKLISDGYETVKSIAKAKSFNVSDYISKKGHCEQFQEKLDEYKAKNNVNIHSTPSLPTPSNNKTTRGSSVLDESVTLQEPVNLGLVSSGSSILVNALYNDGFHNHKDAKVKLTLNNKTAYTKLMKEYNVSY